MKFRKKPVEIEAMQFTTDDPMTGREISWWCGGRYYEEAKASDPTDIAARILIPTLEGVMTAMPGDWIIRGVKGEFYPCKPDIFEATYEPVDVPVAQLDNGREPEPSEYIDPQPVRVWQS